MPPAERLKVMPRRRVARPLRVRRKGYLAWGKLGISEDLPKDVFK